MLCALDATQDRLQDSVMRTNKADISKIDSHRASRRAHPTEAEFAGGEQHASTLQVGTILEHYCVNICYHCCYSQPNLWSKDDRQIAKA